MNQAELDQANARFWGEEICGTFLAKRLRRPTVQRFDRSYLGMYPWLTEMADWLVQPGDDVLEIGPGWGTFARQLILRRARYTALDIAPLVISHIDATTPRAKTVVGSVLALNERFPDESFDAAAAIGSLHHTGNLPLAVARLHDVLRPGGKLLAMIYGDGNVCDFHLDGTPAPWTDITPPLEVPPLFSAFTLVELDFRGPHDHTDIYVRATK